MRQKVTAKYLKSKIQNITNNSSFCNYPYDEKFDSSTEIKQNCFIWSRFLNLKITLARTKEIPTRSRTTAKSSKPTPQTSFTTPTEHNTRLLLLLLFLYIISQTSGFSNFSQNITVLDQTPALTRVGQIGNGLPGISGPFEIHVEDRTNALFTVDSNDGSVTTKVQVQRSSTSSNNMYYMIAFTNNAQIDVTIYVISSTSSRAPIFRPTSFSSLIPLENQFINYTFFVATVTDPNENDTVKQCTIISDPGSNNNASSQIGSAFPFTLKQTAAPNRAVTLELVLSSVVNLLGRYIFGIKAVDSSAAGMQSILRVNITMVSKDSNVPPNPTPSLTFVKSRYEITVNENTESGVGLVQLQATSPDSNSSRIKYTLAEMSSNDEFAINSTTGWLSLRRLLNVDYKDTYDLVAVATITTSAGASTATTLVHIKVTTSPSMDIQIVFLTDDGSPKISKLAMPNDPVAYVSLDNVDASFQFDVALEGGEGRFGLTTSGDMIYLVVVSKSLADAKPLYSMRFKTFYLAHPLKFSWKDFVLRIVENNGDGKDYPLMFENLRYDVALDGASQVGTEVLTVKLLSDVALMRQKKNNNLNSLDSNSTAYNNTSINHNTPRYRFNMTGAFEKYFHLDSLTGTIVTSHLFDCSFWTEMALGVEAYRPFVGYDVLTVANNLAYTDVVVKLLWSPTSIRAPSFEKPFYRFEINLYDKNVDGSENAIKSGMCFGKQIHVNEDIEHADITVTTSTMIFTRIHQ
ncbi:hypothetical protein HELRODRAFT_167420 [Helobdella robusta]|uniref:Cadherin domain-containing protein n=1 Tax=Helobdella robusta TaxID=6412 RepID=T1EZC4_HELRO|nr:hypothetical protein HELRODRAFT_167420 [Helobdella robusta]ESO10908.1 hypothetical protein HELRODRAFT_167420 [Helobdella robusta]